MAGLFSRRNRPFILFAKVMGRAPSRLDRDRPFLQALEREPDNKEQCRHQVEPVTHVEWVRKKVLADRRRSERLSKK